MRLKPLALPFSPRPCGAGPARGRSFGKRWLTGIRSAAVRVQSEGSLRRCYDHRECRRTASPLTDAPILEANPAVHELVTPRRNPSAP